MSAPHKTMRIRSVTPPAPEIGVAPSAPGGREQLLPETTALDASTTSATATDLLQRLPIPFTRPNATEAMTSPLPPGGNPVRPTAMTRLVPQLDTMRQWLERLGGIEGVLVYMTKIQKWMGTLQQMKPLLQLFLRRRTVTPPKNPWKKKRSLWTPAPRTRSRHRPLRRIRLKKQRSLRKSR